MRQRQVQHLLLMRPRLQGRLQLLLCRMQVVRMPPLTTALGVVMPPTPMRVASPCLMRT
jgi:hypothetical protein